MGDTDEGVLDLVPPSPILSSTQRPSLSSQHLPPLPRLILPGSPVGSELQLSPVARSSQHLGSSVLSPFATLTQQPSTSSSLLSPLAASTQQPSTSSTLLSPQATSTQQAGSSRGGVRALSDWVLRTPNQEQRTIRIPVASRSQEEVREISDDEDDGVIHVATEYVRSYVGDSDSDVSITVGDSESDVVSVDSSEDPDIDQGESDTESAVGSPVGVGEQAEDRLTEDANNEEQNTTLVEGQDSDTREENAASLTVQTLTQHNQAVPMDSQTAQVDQIASQSARAITQRNQAVPMDPQAVHGDQIASQSARTAPLASQSTEEGLEHQTAPSTPQVSQDPTQVTPGPLQVSQGPLQGTPGPSQVSQGPLQGTPGPSQVSQGPLQGTPGPSHQAVQAITGQRESPADFRSPKRRRVISPVKSSVKGEEKGAAEDDLEDNECCPICFEPWTTSGNHRLCSLKCGHLFGQSCIDKWLKGQGGKCPHCNAKAKRQDIRVIYAKSIKALDTTEKDRALKDLEKEKEARRKAEMEAAELRLKYQMAVEDSNRFRAELENLRHNLKLGGNGINVGGLNISSRNPNDVLSKSQPTGRFMADKVIKIWDAGNCRVMAYSPPLATIVVSQPSSSPLFPGFGVKKLSTLDFKTSQYMTVHSKAIRDIAFHPSVDNGMLLSCGLDKKVKMTNLLSNAVVQSYDTPMPAWSCVWNTDDENYFYTGLQNGLTLEFDVRNTDAFVQEINSGSSRSPVAALKYMPKNLQATFSAGGLLIGQLDRVQFYESLPNNHYKPHILPLDGSLTSLYIDPATRHILASFRPTARHPHVRHQLCELVWHTVGDATCSCNVVFTFQGGRTQTVLSKTVLIQHPTDSNRLLVCAGDETDSMVRVWDSGSGQRTQSLSTGGITLDTCSLMVNQHMFLATLSEKKLNLFKWC